ncbi:chromosome partition protein Smc [Oceaniovalibus guishaninsula JLT2003]|uniref:Chromosome partition protein Smc n=1 Tax=Oceaniovalibus guishaninsula JLT2003 TaxID=1231392 RepID=K2HCF9_9RHOB|nr:chromosome segregation protein SMC [Oceaniovalibus guishaninsula]EKE44297.1 chromosome partition protein Smc [Oceaniovalibus guishaninsula JLT2003]
MRFTRLRLNGFKSFVDPTDLVIRDGLTGVVGPNGCGKSNLLEALRWVMGEHRPTAMRGGGMEDVIFAGAASRTGRNFAEVSLHIDNTDRLAPAAFNDADAIEVVRRITRDAGSAYRIGGREVRARDVQMLFADAASGAQSPALVRQGQISELIAAKPTARRRILEDAAGIAGLYQRRHEAEAKLRAAEANLARLDDVIAQLAGRLAQLAAQVRQADRYRAIAEALRAAEKRLALARWIQAVAAQTEAAEALRAARIEAARAGRVAQDAAAARAEADRVLPPLRDEAAIAGALVQRLQAQSGSLGERSARARDRIGGLRARVAQIDRDAAREDALNRDADTTVAALDAEAAELRQAARGQAERIAAADSAAAQAEESLAGLEARLAGKVDTAARLGAHHDAAGRRLASVQDTLTRLAAAKDRAANDLTKARQVAAQTCTAAEAATEAAAKARDDAAGADRALAGAERALAEARTRDTASGVDAAQAEGAAATLRAETATLERLLRQDAPQARQALDDVEVAPGFEAALAAAFGDDLAAPLTTSAPGWVARDDMGTLSALPTGAEPLAAHVTAPPALRLRLSQVGIVAPDMAERAQAELRPGQRLVSMQGAVWRWDGFSAAAGAASGATARRLEQRNRLAALGRDLAEAEAMAAAARAAQARDALEHAAAAATEKDARTHRRTAQTALNDAERAMNRAAAAAELASNRAEDARRTAERLAEEEAAARSDAQKARQALDALDDPQAAQAATEDARAEVAEARRHVLSCRSARDAERSAADARTARLERLSRDAATWRERLQSAGARLADLAERRDRALSDRAEAERAPARLEEERRALEADLSQAGRRRALADEAMARAQTEAARAAETERAAERAAGAAREDCARAEGRQGAAQAALAQVEARIGDELDVSPRDLALELAAEGAAQDVGSLEGEVARLRRKRDGLGAVNLRAAEDAREASAEHDRIAAEKADLEQAIAALRTGIAGLNRDGRERLLTAFEQVNANFGMLFKTLFGGGEARLDLVESDDPLDAGLEILCQPPGKRLSALSLLSGGEQTLCAMALIFAVFLANPAPICVLDEVDAPLDDANVTRFCDFLDEMTRRTATRFLVITHHAVTMARMDRLFGVTMGEQGVSQLVSVDLRRAETLVA